MARGRDKPILKREKKSPTLALVVADGMAEELILGADFMQRWKVKLDPEREEIIIDRRALRHLLI